MGAHRRNHNCIFPFLLLLWHSSNILLGAHFEAKLSDFGLAREATGGSQPGGYTHATIEQQRDLFETYAYLPSEFLTSNRRFGVTTDVYSFGVVCRNFNPLFISSL